MNNMKKLVFVIVLTTLSEFAISQSSTGRSNPVVLQFPAEPAVVTPTGSKGIVLASDVDINLPKTGAVNPNGIAVIIGNRDYSKTKNVDYAIHDARAMKMYLTEVFGFKEGNIFYFENATKSDFEVVFGNKGNHEGKLYNAVKPDLSDVFVFYSGHGAPDLKNYTGYFVPVDSDPQYISITGYSSDVFFENLSKVPSRSTTIVLDACFSGADLLEGVSPVGIKSKNFESGIKGALLSSSAGTQVSSWYAEKNHGMFTYFFLKAIQDANADYDGDKQLKMREIHQYVSDKSEGVPYYARRYRNVDQTPTIQGTQQDFVLVTYR